MKRVKIIFFVILGLVFTGMYANAKDVQTYTYSKISTSFVLTKTIKCDKVKAKFKVFAEGDNYNMALQRITKINNGFVNFLRKVFSPKEIQTSNMYSYSKTAVIYVSINSKKISKIPEVLRYITNKKFQYKTGIKPVYIRFTVSNNLKNKVKNALFLEALNRATAKLAIVNSVLSNGYKIGSLDIETNTPYPVLYDNNMFRGFSKSTLKSSANSNNIQTSPGSVTLKLKVRLEMIKEIN